jgi:hypothetical protein
VDEKLTESTKSTNVGSAHPAWWTRSGHEWGRSDAASLEETISRFSVVCKLRGIHPWNHPCGLFTPSKEDVVDIVDGGYPPESGKQYGTRYHTKHRNNTVHTSGKYPKYRKTPLILAEFRFQWIPA